MILCYPHLNSKMEECMKKIETSKCNTSYLSSHSLVGGRAVIQISVHPSPKTTFVRTSVVYGDGKIKYFKSG